MKAPLKIKSIGRKYIRLAAVYRRFSERNPAFDYSVDALKECFMHESTGLPYNYLDKSKKPNGYIQGKFSKKLTYNMWVEDIKQGSACKYEFCRGINKWWAEPALARLVVPVPLFAYEGATARSIGMLPKGAVQ
jgi:hypothetical protein